MVHVEVMKDMFETGQPINPADLTMGGCVAIREEGPKLIFEADLQGCRSRLTVCMKIISKNELSLHYPKLIL